MRMRWTRTNRSQAIAAVLGLWGACTPGVAQTIPNPSFEANSFTNGVGYITNNSPILGWTTTDPAHAGLNPVSGTNHPFADNGVVPDGTNVAFIRSNPPGLNSSLSTVISNLTVGQTYKVNFRVNASGGNTPNLKVDIAGTNVINTTITSVESATNHSIPYKYFAFDFTAAATNQIMTLTNDASGDHTVLLDNFSIAVRNSGWSYAAWTNDASSGLDGTKTYTHAFRFGTTGGATINGVAFTGIDGGNPSNSGTNAFSTAGLPNVVHGATSDIGGASQQLATNFLWGGTNESITLNGLKVGNSYVATIYSVGFENGARAATFSVGNDRLTVNQDQFNVDTGIRVSYAYTASAQSLTLTYVPLNSGVTFHTYGFSNVELTNGHAPFLIVTNLADSGPGTLRQVIANALPGETITFDPALSGQTNVLTSGELLIPYNLTVDASALPAGFKISGHQNSRVFEVAASTVVTLNSLTIQDGLFSVGLGGGGIYVNSGASLTLTNCTLSGNSANNTGGSGGGIFYIVATVTINGSTFSGNSAGFGGGIYNGGGTLTINGSTFSGNSASNNGGGIYNGGDNSTLTINGSTFSGNSASGSGSDGGGIFHERGRLTINGSTFSGNSASGSDGGIFTGQNAIVTINGSTFSGNSASNTGGGLFLTGGNSYLTNTIVAGNSAPSSPNIFGLFSGANNLTTGDPLLAPLNNYGGPTATMRPRPGSPAIDAGLDSITNLLATDQRGYPRRSGAHVDIGAVEAQLTMVSNLNDSGVGSLRAALAAPTELIGFATNLAGGTITLTSGQVTIASNVTVDATALAPGLAISGNHASRIFRVSPGATVTLNVLSLINGNAVSGGSGGAILVQSNGTLTLNSAIVSSNSATGAGGGIENFGGAVNINNSTLSGNAAAGAGAIENDAGTLTISASTLSGNSAIGNGGAIDNDAGATLLLNSSTFSGNSAGGGGGGLENYQATATINNSTLSANSASFAGGINNYGTLALTNVIVAGNTAPSFPDLYLDSSGSFTGANNLTNGTPLLAAPGNYGGPTPTMPPLHGSPAIDAGTDSVTNFLATDQRGFPRLSGAHVDIGAVEVQFGAVPANNPPVLKNAAWTSAGGTNTFQFSFTNVPVADFTVLATTNVSLPLTNWLVLGNIQQISSGQYQFTDLGATNYPRRFYRVISP